MTLLVVALACQQGTPDDDRRTVPGAPVATAIDPDRVALTPEAAAQAGLVTEVVHERPFAVTLALLARLSPVAETSEELAARLAWSAAETRALRAAQELSRVSRLAADRVVATKALQAAEADAAEAQVERLRAETALRNLGLEPGRTTRYPRADVWALGDLYGPQASEVRAGAAAWIQVESFPGETFPGRVVSLARFLKPDTRTLTVRIAVEDPRHRLRPQDVGTAEIEVSQRSTLSVPASALLYEGSDRVLFVAKDGAFVKLRAHVGAEQAGRAEILDGLRDGDAVVTRGGQFLLGETYKVRAPTGAEED
jgi:hypothetical protein